MYVKKGKSNLEVYKELKKKYKIRRISSQQPTQEELDSNDIVYYGESCYLHGEYFVYKMPKELTDDEMALICDNGNLCFGYHKMGVNGYNIYED